MKLNANQIKPFIIFHGEDDINQGKPAQIGWDVTLKAVSKIPGNGKVFIDKVELSKYQKVETDDYGDGKECWLLTKGVYSLTFYQGIQLDSTHHAGFIHRSSVLRNCAEITSGIFDPGFVCSESGATLIVNETIMIEQGARVAQLWIEENYEAEKYKGNYQADKDIK